MSTKQGGQSVRQPEAATQTKKENPAWRPGEPPDDVSSAPESGTVRDETSGNNPAKGDDFEQEGKPAQGRKDNNPAKRPGEPPDDVSSAPESGTVR